jgi:plasmid maintenance system antidote protein VapI
MSFSEDELLDYLRREIKFGTNVSDLAKQLNVSRSYMSEVLNKKRGIGDAIIAALGMEKCFRKIKKLV